MSIATYDLASLTYDSATTAYDGGGLGVTNMPVVGVFVAFTDSPYTADPQWTEITQYVRDINVRRGRQNDLQQFGSGSANVTLDNRTRLFDPFNTAGIYYGNLKPRRQIKIVGQWAGITYPIFRGYIAGFPVQYVEGGKDSTVDIDCFDALGLLAAETTTNDYVQSYTLQASPVKYWRCNDSAGTSIIRETISLDQGQALTNVHIFAPTGAPVFSEYEPLAKGLLGSSAEMFNYSNLQVATTVGGGTDLPVMWLMFWVQGNKVSVLGEWQMYFTLDGNQIIVKATPNNGLQITAGHNSGNGVQVGLTPKDSIYATPAHIAIRYVPVDGAEVSAIYINGVNQPSSTWTSSVIVGGIGVTPSSVTITEGIFQEIAAFDKDITTTQLTNIYNAAVARYTQSARDRFTLYNTFTSFPAALTSNPSTTTSTVSELVSDRVLLQELQVNAKSEGGELYASKDGIVTFVNREYFGAARSAISQMTFTDTGTGVFYDKGSLRMAYDADIVRNDVTVAFTGDGNVAVTDPTSIASIGSSSESVATYLSDPTEGLSLANRTLNLFKNSKLLIEPFMVKGQRNPSYDWQRLLALELLDRFTFVRTPSVGSAVSQDMLLQSIEHRITPSTWETTVNGSARYTGWFIIGVSLIGGTDVLL
jgi:hypothetical protein